MDDLISREALRERMVKIRKYCEKRGYGDGDWKMPIMFVDEAPAVDAAPVVHGQWEIVEEPNHFDVYGNHARHIQCSVCGFTWTSIYEVQTYFKGCPNCLARMDGGKEDAAD